MNPYSVPRAERTDEQNVVLTEVIRAVESATEQVCVALDGQDPTLVMFALEHYTSDAFVDAWERFQS